RGNVNPFAATLIVNKNDPSFQPMSTPVLPTSAMPDAPPQTPVGMGIPRAAFANLVRIDLVFKPDHHMTLDYTVRVRDHRNIMADKGLSARGQTCTGDGRGISWACTTMFAPAAYVP